jgi:DNA-binding CsgD family transcriptional regulator/PAS domain-containing protein
MLNVLSNVNKDRYNLAWSLMNYEEFFERRMTSDLSPQDVSTLIGSIYDCALDPSRWEQTLDKLKGAFTGLTAMLHLNDLRHHRLLLHRTVGLERHALDLIAKHMPEINARLKHDLASWPSLDEPHLISRHLPRAYVESSPYIQECLKPHGFCDVITYFLLHTPTRLGGLAFGRHERDGVFTERELELGRLLMPHVRRAVTISNALDVNAIKHARVTQLLDGLRCAVLMTNERGTVLYANRSAERMLRSGDLIQSARGILRAKTPSAATELRAAIRLAARDDAAIGKTGLAVRLSGLDVAPVFAHVLPMRGGELRIRLQPASVAAIFIGAPPDEQDGADAVAAAFGLTPAETGVLASLLVGRTLAATATTLGIAVATAKTHLEHIFSKTGVTRHADLMLLWARLASPTGSGQDGAPDFAAL